MEHIGSICEIDFKTYKNEDSFLQSSMWGEFKSCFGWNAKAFQIEWLQFKEQKTALLVLCRFLAPGFSFAYVPWGPNLPLDFCESQRQKAAAELAVKLKPFLSNSAAFIRFEPKWLKCEEQDEKFLKAGFKKAAVAVQPPDTVIIDLNKTCDELLMQMKSKWRYNISLAEKKGVHVKLNGIEEIETFYNLLKETALRDGIAVHGLSYYKTLFEINGDNICLYTASHNGDFLAAIVVLFWGKEAIYLYGASSNNKRNMMAPYALQWKAMRDAKDKGCSSYDLFGIPPDENPNHPMAGLYRFKTGFGGNIIHRGGTWDYPYKPIIYSFFKIAEVFRKKMMNIKKRNNKK